MKIGVIGAGYVGLVAGTCLSEMGNHVTVVDINPKVVDKLNRGEIHIFEPGLAEMVQRNTKEGRLSFTTNVVAMAKSCPAIFMAVGTPQGEDGSANLTYLEEAAVTVAKAMNGHRSIIIKSTVPVGTNAIIAKLVGKHTKHSFDLISNPEFLKEGAAIEDFMRPDRVVVGVRNDRARDLMQEIYYAFLRTGKSLMVMDPESAEMTKYVSNALLACRISFMNEMAGICAATGADVDLVRVGVGSDRRIGHPFLFPGMGYGGSCFPKDVRALASVAAKVGVPAELCLATDRVNVRQRLYLMPFIEQEFGSDLRGITFAIWGLAFKPKTDDVREAPAVALARALMDRGARIKAYDPQARETAKREPGMDKVTMADKPYDALKGANALIIATEWNEFRNPDFDAIRAALKKPVIFDGRNIYAPDTVAAAGIAYYSIGRRIAKPAKPAKGGKAKDGKGK